MAIDFVQAETWAKATFPGLAIAGIFQVTSDFDPKYNCIAWAAHDSKKNWWPLVAPPWYWPKDLPLANSLESFIAAFKQMNFVECTSRKLKAGHEKVAIYCKGGLPTHMARQLPDGTWTSKLGKAWDISHKTVQAIEGDMYGHVSTIMVRKMGP